MEREHLLVGRVGAQVATPMKPGPSSCNAAMIQLRSQAWKEPATTAPPTTPSPAVRSR